MRLKNNPDEEKLVGPEGAKRFQTKHYTQRTVGFGGGVSDAETEEPDSLEKHEESPVDPKDGQPE